MEERLIFITGGARSGKSTFAENYAQMLAKQKGGSLHYIASSYRTDEEMEKRIRLHEQQRVASGARWTTWECPLSIGKLAPSFRANDIVLLDCLTILLTNELFQDGYEESVWRDEKFQRKVVQSIEMGIDAIVHHVCVLIVVSNEVLNEPFQEHSLIHTYGKLLGFLHQQLVQKASQAYLVEAGVPILMKEYK